MNNIVYRRDDLPDLGRQNFGSRGLLKPHKEGNTIINGMSTLQAETLNSLAQILEVV